MIPLYSYFPPKLNGESGGFYRGKESCKSKHFQKHAVRSLDGENCPNIFA